VYSLIFRVYSSSIGWLGSRPGRVEEISALRGALTAGPAFTAVWVCAAKPWKAREERKSTEAGSRINASFAE
jgi:hypothetical protein